jgi:cell division protein ZapA|uniref:cell division protein ZapA n=1 Tax=Sphingomonas sp. TaxID=28214 RepID=UPI0025D25EE1|nr:cell division protein ZapA [Sphingomonas sp.]
MADVTLTIGGHRHIVACRDGEEDQLLRVGVLLDSRWSSAARASGGVGGERAMLFVALMLADDLHDAQNRLPEGAPTGVTAEWLENLADRLEALAGSLEN